MNLGTCRSCGAHVRWVTTINGKKMPLDAAPSEDGNFVIEGDIGRAATAMDFMRTKYKSHFATCTDPKAHRKHK